MKKHMLLKMALCSILLFTGHAFAASKVALIIGKNSKYDTMKGDLKTAETKDINAILKALNPTDTCLINKKLSKSLTANNKSTKESCVETWYLSSSPIANCEKNETIVGSYHYHGYNTKTGQHFSFYEYMHAVCLNP